MNLAIKQCHDGVIITISTYIFYLPIIAAEEEGGGGGAAGSGGGAAAGSPDGAALVDGVF